VGVTVGDSIVKQEEDAEEGTYSAVQAAITADPQCRLRRHPERGRTDQVDGGVTCLLGPNRVTNRQRYHRPA